MFRQLPTVLRTMILDYISPPKWKDCVDQIIDWANSPDVPFQPWQFCTVELEFVSRVEESSPDNDIRENMGYGWRVTPKIQLRREGSTFTTMPYIVWLKLDFQEVNNGYNSICASNQFITDEETGPEAFHLIYDLLSYCPRSVTKLPKSYRVYPIRFGCHPWTKPFPGVEDYRTSCVTSGPGFLLAYLDFTLNLPPR